MGSGAQIPEFPNAQFGLCFGDRERSIYSEKIRNVKMPHDLLT